MIFDDELDLRQLFGKALRSKYNVILVGSGEDCIESSLMKKSWGKKIHLVLLDYRLGVCIASNYCRCDLLYVYSKYLVDYNTSNP